VRGKRDTGATFLAIATLPELAVTALGLALASGTGALTSLVLLGALSAVGAINGAARNLTSLENFVYQTFAGANLPQDEELNEDGSISTFYKNQDGTTIKWTIDPHKHTELIEVFDSNGAFVSQRFVDDRTRPISQHTNADGSVISIYRNPDNTTMTVTVQLDGSRTVVARDGGKITGSWSETPDGTISTFRKNGDGTETSITTETDGSSVSITVGPDGRSDVIRTDSKGQVTSDVVTTGSSASMAVVHGTSLASDPQPTLIGGGGNNILVATGGATVDGGDGNNIILYNVPILYDPQQQAAAHIFTGNGNDIVAGFGPAEIDLGKGNDFVLPGFCSIVNADGDPNRGQDVIFTADNVQLNNLQAQDRINLLGVMNLTGGIQWKGSESPFAYGTFAKYGLNQDGELVITTYLGDGQTMFVSNYHGGPGVPISQETAGIFIAQADIGASLLLKAPPGWGPVVPNLMKALLKASLGPDILTKIGIDPRAAKSERKSKALMATAGPSRVSFIREAAHIVSRS
jgi:hypothetical protein